MCDPTTDIMIRDFELFCNLNRINKLDLLSLLYKSIAQMVPSKQTCPSCGSTHCCNYYDKYDRNMVVFINGNVIAHRVWVPRLECSSCKTTHAFLPACLIPHSPYSLLFVLEVLRSYFSGSLKVAQLCSQFCIVASTLYDWINLFKEHKSLWLGALKDLLTTPAQFLLALFQTDSFLADFFKLADISFMQFFKFTSRSNSP